MSGLICELRGRGGAQGRSSDTEAKDVREGHAKPEARGELVDLKHLEDVRERMRSRSDGMWACEFVPCSAGPASTWRRRARRIVQGS
jgi:hypothetical protein